MRLTSLDSATPALHKGPMADDCCSCKGAELERLATQKDQRRVLIAVLAINAAMFLAEFGAGVIAGSTALMADSVDMLGDALVWAAGAAVARNRIFNVTNGDLVTWRDCLPVVADHFGIAMGGPADVSIAREIDARAADWTRLVDEQGLEAPREVREFLGEAAGLADFAMRSRKNVVTSTIAIRQAGFAAYHDSADCVRKWFERWEAEKLLPRR